MSLRTGFMRLFLPHTCILCAEHAEQSRDLCVACEKELPWADLACKQCGLRLSAATTSELCGQCQQHPPAFDRVFSLCDYIEPMDRIIAAAKFHQQLVYTRLLGELLTERACQRWYKNQALPDLILPVPLHASRLKERGYNQSLEIAKVVALKLNIPLGKDYCERQKATAAQSSLAHAERSHNVKNAFVLKKPLNLQHVAIVDDIITTGHTVDELSKILRAAGVQQIDVWCCARTQWDRTAR